MDVWSYLEKMGFRNEDIIDKVRVARWRTRCRNDVEMVWTCEKEIHECSQCGGVGYKLWMVSGKVEIDRTSIGKSD